MLGQKSLIKIGGFLVETMTPKSHKKGSKSQTQFFIASHAPKNQRKFSHFFFTLVSEMGQIKKKYKSFIILIYTTSFFQRATFIINRRLFFVATNSLDIEGIL